MDGKWVSFVKLHRERKLKEKFNVLKSKVDLIDLKESGELDPTELGEKGNDNKEIYKDFDFKKSSKKTEEKRSVFLKDDKKKKNQHNLESFKIKGTLKNNEEDIL